MYRRLILALVAVLAVSACSDATVVTDETPQKNLGDFAFGHNVVVTTDMKQGPFSRTATEEEIGTALKAALDERLGRYEGDKLYHLGIKVEAYALAAPGIPVLFKPKTALILTVTAWDDAASAKLNEEPRMLTIFEGTSAETFIGSGLTRSKEKQIEVVTRNAAERIERWLEENGTWFGVESAQEAVSQEDDTAAALDILAPGADPAALEAAAAAAAQQQSDSN